MDRNVQLAIGAGVGLGVLLAGAYALGTIGAKAVGGAANQLPPSPSPVPPTPSPGPPAPPVFDPTNVTPGTTFTGILTIAPDATVATQAPPATLADVASLLQLASMRSSFIAQGSVDALQGDWTVVATYNGTNPSIDLTKPLPWAVTDGRQYIVSWSSLSTVGGNVA